jgi:hypothetical protein
MPSPYKHALLVSPQQYVWLACNPTGFPALQFIINQNAIIMYAEVNH